MSQADSRTSGRATGGVARFIADAVFKLEETRALSELACSIAAIPCFGVDAISRLGTAAGNLKLRRSHLADRAHSVFHCMSGAGELPPKSIKCSQINSQTAATHCTYCMTRLLAIAV